jgi:sec-independent protein translocase protein TatB
MFDVGWSEILVIAAVAIVVAGPKDLPRMLRTFGKTMGQVRRTANDFKRQFDEALREAEREAGLEETKKQLSAATKPLTDVKKDLDATMRAAEKPVTAASPAPVAASSPEPEKTADHPHVAEPVKTGAPTPAHGSDAA